MSRPLTSNETILSGVLAEVSIAAWLDGAFDWLFYALIFATIFFLSGSINGFNFYLPLCLLILPFAVHSLFRRRLANVQSLTATLCILGFVLVWMVLGLCNNFEFLEVKEQASEILLTFFVCWIAHVFNARESLRRLRFLRLVLASMFASAVAKIGIVLYAITHGIPVMDMVVRLDKIFGSDLITMGLGDLLGRIQFSADALIPVCIFIILRHRVNLGIGSLRASLMILVLVVSVILSFSRYFWAFTALAFVMGLLLGKKDRFQAVLAAILGISILVSLPALVMLYQLRFSSAVAGSSDAERTEQYVPLEQFFWDSPWAGHGMGSYTTQLIRGSETGRHNYEVQLLALLGQIGILGVLALTIIMLWYYSELWIQASLPWRDRFATALLLLTWIVGGFSNPLLFNPLAGIIYASLATLIVVEEKPSAPPEAPAASYLPRAL